MPTSIAHALGGFAAVEGSPLARGWSRARVFLFCALVANLPDLDFVPGLLVGDAGRFHRHGSHSLLAALLVSLACALWLRWRSGASRGDAVRFAALAALVYGSHLLLDMLVTSPTETSGVPLFWPIEPARYYAIIRLPRPLAALLDLDFDKSQPFFRSLLSVHGVLVFLGHGLLFAPLPALAWLVRRAWAWTAERGAAPPARAPAQPAFGAAPEPAGED